MANTLNNFGLAELTLKTANKWCTANIDVKIDSAELENIKPEYLRSGAEVFGVSGIYGDAQETATIPAGIYEFLNTSKASLSEGFDITFQFYHNGVFGNTFGYGEDIDHVMFPDGEHNLPVGSSATRPSIGASWLDYLVLVPEDESVSADTFYKWHAFMHPYVSCMDQDTKQELSATELANRIMADQNCEHYGDKTYINNNNGTHQVICNQCSQVLNYSETHEYSEGYCVCGATSGSSCDHTNWVYYEGSWTDYAYEYENAQFECRCSGATCQCNFRAPFESDTWPNCPCCGSDVNYVGYVGGDPSDPGDPDPDQYIECPECGQYQYDGNVCHNPNCNYGMDIPDDTTYTCPSCSNPITSWDEYPYTGQCSEGHDVNLHDPEYCSHTKINWQCTNGECGASGTYCSGWSFDSETDSWVGNGRCPLCQNTSVYTY